jgi:predicted dehydrogenase
MKKLNVGIIGCGNISKIYLEQSKTFDVLAVTAVADTIAARAQEKAAQFQVRALSVDEILADKDINIILNITPPAAHASIALAALTAGKSVYNEKPLAILREDAQKMLQLAGEKNLRVGCAPDTFMGAGLQTCRRLIDQGEIGKPVAATAFMMGHGPERWHPDPEFFYKPGAGPLFDMAPYYLTALISLLGPVKRLSSMARISFQERMIGSEPKRGQVIKVETPTHVSANLEFTSGAMATLITSFDVWKSSVPRIEIYGSEATLWAPDPNTFGGPVQVFRSDSKEWSEMPLITWRSFNSRSLGLADMAHAILSGRPHRANGEMAYHVLDIMHTILEASQEGKELAVNSSCAQPAPLPDGLPFNMLD